MTPNYPADYDAIPVGDDPLECVFQITAPAGYQIELKFKDIELASTTMIIVSRLHVLCTVGTGVPFLAAYLTYHGSFH